MPQPTHNLSENLMNGGEILVSTLIAHTIDTAFFVPGGTFVTVMQALSNNLNRIRPIGTRLESSAVFAAEAYAGIRHRPACVFVSRAPGATNAAIGIHSAMQASRPLVLFVANIPRSLKQREAFQEIDYMLMYTPIAKAVFEVSSFDEVSAVTARAIELSKSGRPGPVVVVISKDILDGRTGAPSIIGPSAPVRVGADPSAVAQAAQLIDAAAKPVILCGEMIAFEACHAQLQTFAEKTGAPVFTAYRQQDTFSAHHEAYAGHLGLNRSDFQDRAFKQSDLVISVGHRMDSVTTADYLSPRPGQPLIMIYPDPAVFSQWPTQVALGSHCAPALEAISQQLEKRPDTARLDWRDGLHDEQAVFSDPAQGGGESSVDMVAVVASFARQVDPASIVITDAGTFSRWVQRYYPFSMPATALGPISGAMGYGIQGGLGAAVAVPDRSTFVWVGDGGFLMTGHELATIVQEALPVKIIVCDNAAWGSILVHQHKRFPGWDYGTRLASPDFSVLAQGYGIPAFIVRKTDEFPGALDQVMAQTGPALIHLHLDPRDLSEFSGSSH